jgi:hypothetical protein
LPLASPEGGAQPELVAHAIRVANELLSDTTRTAFHRVAVRIALERCTMGSFAEPPLPRTGVVLEESDRVRIAGPPMPVWGVTDGEVACAANGRSVTARGADALRMLEGLRAGEPKVVSALLGDEPVSTRRHELLEFLRSLCEIRAIDQVSDGD